MYGAATPKRHVAWSSSPTVQCLDIGTLTKQMKKQIDKSGVKSTKKYHTKEGKQGFSGSKQLRATGNLVFCCWIRFDAYSL